jgi:hypothetical protein
MKRGVAMCAVLWCAASTAAHSQAAPQTTVPVLFSVSGAASLGTYQSGATWAVLRFLQLANADSTLRPPGRRNVRYELGALSGTSAGNVNALISALEWCRHEPVRPENSLFAQLWLDVGLGQLNPANNAPPKSSALSVNTAAGLLSRTFFATLWDTITTSMRRPLWDPNCNLPIGVTLTRILPALYALQRTPSDSALTAATQRFVTRWRVESDSAARGAAATTISLRPPRTPNDGRSFGAEYLIDAAADASGRDTVDRSIVFQAVQASASVPLIWAAVPLPTPTDSNWAARTARKASGQPAPPAKPADYALFVDGGVFDSDPMSLAVDLWNAEPPAVPAEDVHPMLIRIDPSDLRGLLLLEAEASAAAAAPTSQPPAAGLEPVFALMGGFVPSARQYEMQSLGRALALHASDPRSPRIVHTTRAYHTTAEYFSSFAGFLGRPFRDYDFYLGIYDGLLFAAQQFICADPTVDGPPATQQCVDSVLTHLVIPAVARATPGGAPPLVMEFARCESSGYRDAQCTFPADTQPPNALLRARYAVSAALARKSEQLLRYAPPPDTSAAARCGPHPCDNMVARMLWSDGFGAMLASLAVDTQYKRAIATVRELTLKTKPSCWTVAAAWGSTDGSCPADAAFVRLVNDPERVLDFAFRWELRRLVEIEAKQPHVDGFALRSATVAEMLYTAQAFGYQTTFFAPTTVPETEPSHAEWNLAPYYLSAGMLGAGGVEAGWDFTLRYWRNARIGLTTPVSAWWRSAPAGARSSTAVAAGLGAFYRPLTNQWLNLQLAVQYSAEAAARGLWSASMMSTEVAWAPPVLTKLRFAYRYGPRLYDRTQPAFGPAQLGRNGGAFSIGVQDLPGLAYWAWRLF